MQKRIGIARAIAMNPKYLFCDEPNSGLDPKTSIVIDNLIREITYEYDITTVVITHDMNSVIEIGDTILSTASRPNSIALSIAESLILSAIFKLKLLFMYR